jgi:predicted secreted protein
MAIIIFLMLPVQACTGSDDEKQPVVFKTIPEIQKVKPQKSAKIKLKRNAKGEYSWDINGENSDNVLEINRKLEKELGVK